VIAALFQWLGFSLEIGALIAGMTLSMTNYHHEISSKVKPIRDFFLVLFFIILGAQMGFGNLSENYLIIILLTLFVILIKPVIIMIIMGLLGYTKRNSFMTGVSLAQVSEFSFILITLGINMKQLDASVLSVVTIVGLVSITSSAYLIQYGDKVYNLLSKYLVIFERKGKKIDQVDVKYSNDYDLILFGHNRVGYDVLKSISQQKKKCLVVDFNPETIIQLSKEKVPCVYGDASDIELLHQLDFKKVKMVISTIPDIDTNLMLINRVREINSKVIIIVVAHQIEDALRFYNAGACYVLMPHFVGGNYISTLLQEYHFDMKKFLDEKVKHLNYLKKRKVLGHEHPRSEKAR
jgi:Trk K+ transport system NAD-binding subunit